MQKIFKFILDPNTTVLNIQSETILSAIEQHNEIAVYALVDTHEKAHTYEFVVVGTGQELEFDVSKYSFLGTVKLHSGLIIGHVFYKKI